ncbi:hypothetical protein DICVIV_07256 [Dictyocaulus viviparus]|uniref:Uncharacterized protein n=1 Tax=Dictyocaulus viviparus TaxID=29172 RepID=A0A0D8XSD6_DICVI|nr:hypothetical protein DICVIV_07256 [Dictyocaulus viviparus]
MSPKRRSIDVGSSKARIAMSNSFFGHLLPTAVTGSGCSTEHNCFGQSGVVCSIEPFSGCIYSNSKVDPRIQRTEIDGKFFACEECRHVGECHDVIRSMIHNWDKIIQRQEE